MVDFTVYHALCASEGAEKRHTAPHKYRHLPTFDHIVVCFRIISPTFTFVVVTFVVYIFIYIYIYIYINVYTFIYVLSYAQ